jgi:hypothetical protein
MTARVVGSRGRPGERSTAPTMGGATADLDPVPRHSMSSRRPSASSRALQEQARRSRVAGMALAAAGSGDAAGCVVPGDPRGFATS